MTRPCTQCQTVDVDRPCGICTPCIGRMAADQRVAQGLPPKPTDPVGLDEIARLLVSKRMAS